MEDVPICEVRKLMMMCTHDLTSIRPDDINDIDDIIQIDDTMILIILASF